MLKTVSQPVMSFAKLNRIQRNARDTVDSISELIFTLVEQGDTILGRFFDLIIKLADFYEIFRLATYCFGPNTHTAFIIFNVVSLGFFLYGLSLLLKPVFKFLTRQEKATPIHHMFGCFINASIVSGIIFVFISFVVALNLKNPYYDNISNDPQEANRCAKTQPPAPDPTATPEPIPMPDEPTPIPESVTEGVQQEDAPDAGVTINISITTSNTQQTTTTTDTEQRTTNETDVELQPIDDKTKRDKRSEVTKTPPTATPYIPTMTPTPYTPPTMTPTPDC